MSSTPIASSAKLEEPDLLRLRHLLGAVLMPVSVAAHVGMPAGSPVAATAALVVMLAGLCFPGVFARIGPVAWNRVGLIVVGVVVVDLAVTLSSDRTQFVPAIVRAALAIATMRVLQPRTRREDMQLLLLALFLAAIGGALTLSPLFAVQAVLFLPVAGGLLFLLDRAQADPTARLTRADWERFRAVAFAGRLSRAAGKSGLMFFFGSLLATALAGAAIFRLLPRYELANTLPLIRAQGKGKTGFSDRLKFGEIGEILQDDTPALRADTPGGKRPSRRVYWRMVALDRYAGGEFSVSSMAEVAFRRPRLPGMDFAADPVPDFDRNASMKGDWTVFMEGNVSRYLPMPGRVARVRFSQPREWEWNPSSQLLRLRTQPGDGVPMQLNVVSDNEVIRGADAEIAAFSRPASAASEAYPLSQLALGLDAVSKAALKREADLLSPPGTDTDAFVAAATAWLHRKHAYALSDSLAGIAAKSGDPDDHLVRWMRSDATGWCEHFAGSFVLLARASGRPARLVSGFAGGEWNDSSGYLLVRMKHGHAWAEIYDSESRVWRRVDPTPSAGLIASGAADDPSKLQGMDAINAFYDGVTMWWFRRVVNFDEAEQRADANAVLEKLKSWRAETEATLKRLRTSVSEALTKWRDAPASLARPAAAVLVMAAAVFAMRLLRRRRRAVRVRAASEDDPVVRRYRLRAGKLLASSRRFGAPAAISGPVERIRFGRVSDWPEPEAAFREARRALKKYRRDRRG